MMLIDAHTHLDEYIDYENGAELEKEALQEIDENRILSLAVAMDLPAYERTLSLAKRSSYILPCFGVHPRKAHLYRDSLGDLDEYAQNCKMIGEVGLDYFWAPKETHSSQAEVFEYFLRKAKEHDKVINVHTKGAEGEVVEALKKHRSERVIIHWYSGPRWEFRELLKMGCYFTVGVQLKYSELITDIAKAIPLERLLLETDNPSGEEWLSKRIGMPKDIKSVYSQAARLRKINPVELEEKVYQNYVNL
jgi:TatD DNase family protein